MRRDGTQRAVRADALARLTRCALVDDAGVCMEDSQLICAYLDGLDGNPRFHDASRASDWTYLRLEFSARRHVRRHRRLGPGNGPAPGDDPIAAIQATRASPRSVRRAPAPVRTLRFAHPTKSYPRSRPPPARPSRRAALRRSW